MLHPHIFDTYLPFYLRLLNLLVHVTEEALPSFIQASPPFTFPDIPTFLSVMPHRGVGHNIDGPQELDRLFGEPS